MNQKGPERGSRARTSIRPSSSAGPFVVSAPRASDHATNPSLEVGVMRAKTRIKRLGLPAALLGMASILILAAPVQAQFPSCAGQVATVTGTTGDDILVGSPGNDVIVGLEGNDTIRGTFGNDIICGDEGNDVIRGGPGNDSLSGGLGIDRVVGGDGSDVLVGD